MLKKICIAMLSLIAAVQTGTIISTFDVSAANTDKNIMQNDYLTLYVGQDEDNLGRYQLSANKGNLENNNDDNKNLMYENFYSSYTTVVINGKAYRFGEGVTVTAPYYDSTNNCCTTVQKFGDVEITQTLKFADGMKTGHDDMLLVTYSAKNTGVKDVLFGIRIMLDSQLDKDDKCTLTVDDALLDFEKEYKSSIPQKWSVVSEDGNITAYGKINTIPDSIEFADWSSLFDKKWGYNVDSSKDIDDSAAALVWDNAALPIGETKEYSVYYGVKNPSSGVVPVDDNSSPADNPTENSKDTSNPENRASNPKDTSNPEKTSTPTNSSNSANNSKPSGNSNSANTSTSANTSVSNGGSKSSENSSNENNSIFTGDDRGILIGASAAFLISLSAIAAFLSIKKKGESQDE